jgi:hypothetical protein
MAEKYAVLISGDLAETGYDEFWNDVVLMREALLRNGFAEEHIHVLYGNGADFFSASRPNPRYRPSPHITNLPADSTGVNTVFNGLANGTSGFPQTTDEDLLFVWTFDHGGRVGGHSTLGLMDGSMQDTSFAALVDQVPHAYRVVCMQQCFSGGFLDKLNIDETVIITACAADEVAHRADSPAENEVVGGVTYHHGEFNYYLFAALTGETVTGTPISADANGDGRVVLQEVFDHIQANESRPETPQYDDGVGNLGTSLHLAFAPPTPTPLVSGLGGAIGCDFIHTRNRLVFVEYNGQVSRLDLVRSVDSVVSSGTTTLHGTWSFDFDTGTESTITPAADVFWRQHTNTIRSMEPISGARITNIGVTSFYGVSAAELQSLSYSDTPICGNDDATNLLVNGDVFAVLTNNGNYAKVQVISYGYDLEIRWRTYQLHPAYEVLGSGYSQPEDVVVTQDEQHAYVTERVGNLLRVDLSNADRTQATVVSSGMTAPHQIALDEDRGHAYVVEYANPGRLLRIDLTSGAQTVLASGLEHTIGLVMTDDLRFAYVSEQASSGGRISRIDISAGQRNVVVPGLTNPFFLTWADAGEGAILTTERDPANRVSLIDLTQTPVSVSHLATVPFRPSSVGVVTSNRLLVCCDQVISELNLTESVFVLTGPIILGIGHVPVSCISVDGYADTSADPTYFFQVKDAPFGGTLSLMVNHERAYAEGARYYKVFVDGVIQKQSWHDYRWSTSTNSFTLRTINSLGSGFFRVRRPHELWYNHWLGYRLKTSGLANGLHTIEVAVYSAANNASLMSTDGEDVMIDNQWPTAVIDEIIHDGVVIDACGIVDSGTDFFGFRIQARDPEEHLKSWHLRALWGDNKSKKVDSDSYDNHVSATKKWAGVSGVVPVPPWDARVPLDPTSTRCAHTFYLTVWDRVINGHRYIHRSTYHKSITIMLPPPPP